MEDYTFVHKRAMQLGDFYNMSLSIGKLAKRLGRHRASIAKKLVDFREGLTIEVISLLNENALSF